MQASDPGCTALLTSLPPMTKLFAVALGRARMSTIVHYECRNLDHLRAGSRRGKGGLVIHHGPGGYCDGPHVDGAHPLGANRGGPLEVPLPTAPALDPRTYLTGDRAP